VQKGGLRSASSSSMTRWAGTAACLVVTCQLGGSNLQRDFERVPTTDRVFTVDVRQNEHDIGPGTVYGTSSERLGMCLVAEYNDRSASSGPGFSEC